MELIIASVDCIKLLFIFIQLRNAHLMAVKIMPLLVSAGVMMTVRLMEIAAVTLTCAGPSSISSMKVWLQSVMKPK